MPFCADGCRHATQEEADACRHRSDDKDFANLDLPHPRTSTSKKRTAAPNTSNPVTPIPSKLRQPARKVQAAANSQYYPTPPFTQDNEDIGDNIDVAQPSQDTMMSSPAAAAAVRKSPSSRSAPSCADAGPSSDDVAALASEDTDEFIPGLLSSPSAAASPSPDTTRVPETAFDNDDDAALINDDAIDTTTDSGDDAAPSAAHLADLTNQIRALTADRARLTDTLASSTFRAQNLLTRTKIANINARLARLDADKAEAEAKLAWETIEVAREGRKNAWVSVGLVVGMVLGYGVWCWVNSVEFAYIRSRECGVYGLGEGC